MSSPHLTRTLRVLCTTCVIWRVVAGSEEREVRALRNEQTCLKVTSVLAFKLAFHGPEFHTPFLHQKLAKCYNQHSQVHEFLLKAKLSLSKVQLRQRSRQTNRSSSVSVGVLQQRGDNSQWVSQLVSLSGVLCLQARLLTVYVCVNRTCARLMRLPLEQSVRQHTQKEENEKKENKNK